MADSSFYQRHYGGFLKLGQTELQAFSQQMLAPGKRYHLLIEDLQANNPRGKTLAELGCGGAETLLILQKQYHFDRLIGLDVAAGDNSGCNGEIEYRNANLNSNWPLADSSIDYLIAMMVIEHLFDPFHSFKEIRRVLSTGGRAYVNVPLVTSMQRRIKLAMGILPTTSSPYEYWYKIEEWDGGHLHWFSLASLHDISEHCGLQIECVRGVGRFYNLKSMLPGLLASEITVRLKAS